MMCSEKLHRFLTVIVHLLFFLVLMAGLFLFLVDRWLFETWSELSYEEIVFHLKSSIQGTNPDMVVHALLFYALPGLLIMMGIGLLLYFWRNKKHNRYFLMLGATVISVSLAVFTLFDLQQRIHLLDHLSHEVSKSDISASDSFIEDNYVDPATVTLTFPDKKRNLIYIFLESMECTYADEVSGGAFPKNVIPELTSLAHENENFNGKESTLNGAISLPGATWTMGGMFAQTSGAPLKISMNVNSMQYADSFFPGMHTLGDILYGEGYRQVLAIGSDAGFGGRRAYFASHGNYEIRDYYDAIARGRIAADYYEWWGYEDEKLFAFAKEDLEELAAGEQPFNYTMLTVDTHFEDGYNCRLCETEFGSNQYANAMACSSRQVANFIQWCQKQDFYENTTIVLCGDHPTMDTDFCDNVSNSYQRKTYTLIINGDSQETQGTGFERVYSTMDLFPTTLSAMGVQIEGHRLGLGVDLYSPKLTILELYGIEQCKELLEAPSNYLEMHFGDVLSESTLQMALQNCMISPIFEQRGKNQYHVYFYYTGIGNTSCWLNFNNVSARIEVYDPESNQTITAEMHGTEDYGVGLCEMDIQTSDILDLQCTMFVYVDKADENQYYTYGIGDRAYNIVLAEDHKSMSYIFHQPEDAYKEIQVCVYPLVDGEDSIPEDAIWYDATKREDGCWDALIDISTFAVDGVIAEQTFGINANGNQDFLDVMNLHLGEFPFLR